MLFVLFIYLILGIGYAVYMYLYSDESFFSIPLNVILGPLTMLYLIFVASKKTKKPLEL